MASPYILAKTMRDAHNFAREIGLAKGHYYLVNSPSSISGRRGSDLYLVPGWERRHDRFAMRSALKYTRLNVIYVGEEREDAPTPEVTITNQEAHDFLTDEPESEETQRRTRRRRCPECEELVEPADLEKHAASHFQEQ